MFTYWQPISFGVGLFLLFSGQLSSVSTFAAIFKKTEFYEERKLRPARGKRALSIHMVNEKTETCVLHKSVGFDPNLPVVSFPVRSCN